MRDRTRSALSTAGTASAGVAGAVAGVLLLFGIGALIWWLGVASSSVAGTGNVHKDQQSAQNREHWSATFHGEFTGIQADQDKLRTLKAAATGPGATQRDRIDYLGAQQNCQADVAQYNADAASLLGHPWIPAELPTSINATDYCGS